MLVALMVITMVHFNGAAHYKRTHIYSLGITALSCWRCENFFPLFFSSPHTALWALHVVLSFQIISQGRFVIRNPHVQVCR